VKDQVRMIDDYDRKITDLRNKFTDEVSNLGEKLVNEVDRNMKLEEHIKQLQKHLADLDSERREILTKYDVVSVNEQEFVRDMEDLEDRYKVRGIDCLICSHFNRSLTVNH
jgi:chromosome segregation ATPase